MLNFCTLFDVNYISRGVVLYQSLENCCDEFLLYVMAMDDECYTILNDLKLDKMVVVNVSEMEDERLKEIKANRNRRTYCWTCSSWSIRYFMNRYKLSMCTYLDADEYFYYSPKMFIDEFNNSLCDVAIVSHHLGSESFAQKMELASGKYCVQFNSFKNTEYGMKILDDWCNDCANECEEVSGGKLFGDQKYLELWNDRYSGKVWEYTNRGLGVAPWNSYRYRHSTLDTNVIIDRKTNERIDIVFYHFHNLSLNENSADIGIFTRPGKHDKQWIYPLYKNYIKQLLIIDEYLKKFKVSKPQSEIKKQRYIEKIRQNGFIKTIINSFKYRILNKKNIINYSEI